MHMDFGDAIRDGFSKYATFSGRSSRSAYWWWFLFAILVSVVANILDAIGSTWVVGAILGLALLLPGLAVTVRRYHDAGHSGWWLLLWIIPIVGFVVWLIFTLTDSKPPNEWGQGPDNSPTTYQLDSSGQAMPAPPAQPIDQMPPPPPPPQEPPPPSPPSS
jgi:uncharacterized membrane protein YhaH (DUF805 family)